MRIALHCKLNYSNNITSQNYFNKYDHRQLENTLCSVDKYNWLINYKSKSDSNTSFFHRSRTWINQDGPVWKGFYRPNHPYRPNQNHLVQEVVLFLPVQGGWIARPAMATVDGGALLALEGTLGKEQEQVIFVVDGLGLLAFRLLDRGPVVLHPR